MVAAVVPAVAQVGALRVQAWTWGQITLPQPPQASARLAAIQLWGVPAAARAHFVPGGLNSMRASPTHPGHQLGAQRRLAAEKCGPLGARGTGRGRAARGGAGRGRG
jgi:hypothetical protein